MSRWDLVIFACELYRDALLYCCHLIACQSARAPLTCQSCTPLSSDSWKFTALTVPAVLMQGHALFTRQAGGDLPLPGSGLHWWLQPIHGGCLQPDWPDC